MNTDTARTVKEIKENGWYILSTAIDGEGWVELIEHGINDWKWYELIFMSQGYVASCVKAQDDETALKAFSKLFHLDIPYVIRRVEKMVVYEMTEGE